MGVWSDLQADLLRCISSHLSVLDFLRLSSVCRSWNSALANKDFLRTLCPPSPWLLLPSDVGEASDTLTFKDLSIQEEEEEGSSNCSHRRFSSLGSHISGRRCIGSKDGWLVTLDKKDLQPRLFNPLTKAEISLPSLLTIPEDGDHRMKPQYAPDGSLDFYLNEIHSSLATDWESFRDVYFQKIVLSSNDTFGTAVVIYGYTRLLALARPGDRSWVLGPQLSPYFDIRKQEFDDVYYHAEEQRFYAITSFFSAVIAFDINGQNATLICPALQDPIDVTDGIKNYIAFLSGALIKIRRVIDYIDLDSNNDERYTGKTIEISVFKFVSATAASSCSSSQWISVKDLEGCSLFVGCNQTFSLHHTVAPGIRPNCIYFSDDWEYISPENVDRDAGLFDLHNNCFQYPFLLAPTAVPPLELKKDSNLPDRTCTRSKSTNKLPSTFPRATSFFLGGK